MRVAGRNGFLNLFVSSLGDFFIPLHSVLSGGVSPTLPLLDTLMPLRLWNRDKKEQVCPQSRCQCHNTKRLSTLVAKLPRLMGQSH